jgi:predicted O-methyltransferase YrrM
MSGDRRIGGVEMRLEVLQRAIQGVPYIRPDQGRRLYEFLLAQRPTELLELGFAHGASACYAAAALHELGRGRVTCVDLESSACRDPNFEVLLTRTGLGQFVEIHREPNSYTWFLKRQVEERSHEGCCAPVYDFCYIDGSKNWTVDGCAFFLADKLLRPGGWILFDDVTWTYKAYEEATGNAATDGLTHRTMAPDEYAVPHIEAIFRLLVMQHPDYSEFRIEDSWAFAHKIRSAIRTLRVDTTVSLRARVLWATRKLVRRHRATRARAVNVTRGTPRRTSSPTC